MNQRKFDAPLGDHRLGGMRCRIPNSHGSSLRQQGLTVQNHDAIVYSAKDFHAGIVVVGQTNASPGLDQREPAPLPVRTLKQLDGAMLVVDFQSMRIQKSGADQAFFARTDEHLGQQVFSELLEAQGIPQILETLLRGEFRLKRSQGDQVAGIEDFFADDQP